MLGPFVEACRSTGVDAQPVQDAAKSRTAAIAVDNATPHRPIRPTLVRPPCRTRAQPTASDARPTAARTAKSMAATLPIGPDARSLQPNSARKAECATPFAAASAVAAFWRVPPDFISFIDPAPWLAAWPAYCSLLSLRRKHAMSTYASRLAGSR